MTTLYVTAVPWQGLVLPLIMPGCAGKVLTIILIVKAAEVPQAFTEDTLNVPDVALLAKLIETELPVPFIDAPVPL